MKNLFLTSSLLFLSVSSFADTSGTLLLQGSVSKQMSMAVTAASAASALDLTTTKSDLSVASVNEKSNSKTGYDITITSLNLSKLKRADGPDVFAYTMKYNGSGVALGTSAGTTIANTTASAVNLNKAVTISYTGVAAESMVEGTYADTVTFSIAAH